MEEYSDAQIQEWTKEDLLNSPLLSEEETQQLRENKRYLAAQATEKIRKMMENE
jgi:hypothetical protein